MGIDIVTLANDIANEMAILEFYGIHFYKNNENENPCEVYFSIPKSTELKNSDTKEGLSINHDLSTTEGLISFAKEESWKIGAKGIKATIKNDDKLKNIIHEEEIDLYLNVIREKTIYKCKTIDVHWTKEMGLKAMEDYIKEMSIK